MSNNQGNGNAAAMREALKLALSLLDLDKGCSYKTISQKSIDFIKSALAAPPRNCDVGTAEEQHCRFIEYCNACDCPMGCIHRKQFIGMLDARCASMLKCYIRWAQMPYESEEKNGPQE